jgi:hypothetical protein
MQETEVVTVGNTLNARGVMAGVRDFPLVTAPADRVRILTATVRQPGGELCLSANRDDYRFERASGIAWVGSFNGAAMLEGTPAVSLHSASAASPAREIKPRRGSKAISGTG